MADLGQSARPVSDKPDASRTQKPRKRTVGSIPVPSVPWHEPKDVDTTKVASEENSP